MVCGGSESKQALIWLFLNLLFAHDVSNDANSVMQNPTAMACPMLVLGPGHTHIHTTRTGAACILGWACCRPLLRQDVRLAPALTGLTSREDSGQERAGRGQRRSERVVGQGGLRACSHNSKEDVSTMTRWGQFLPICS